jgi:hypothetical protein
MGIFDVKENIKREFTVGDVYDVDVVDLGMSGTLDDNARLVFKGYSLDEVLGEMKQTKLKTFERFFKKPTWIWISDFKFITLTGWRLKRWLGKWVKKRYITDPDNLRTDVLGAIKGVYVYNGEIIEWATEACFWFRFCKKEADF